MNINIEIPDEEISSYIVCFISNYINKKYSWLLKVEFPDRERREALYCDIRDPNWSLIITTIDNDNININYNNLKNAILQLYHNEKCAFFDIVKDKKNPDKYTSTIASYIIQYASFNELKYSVY